MVVLWLSILASILLVMGLLWAGQQVLVTARLYNRTPLVDTIFILSCLLRTKNAWLVLLPIVSILIFLVVIPLLQIEYPKIILIPIILLHLNTLALYAAPPSVLFLGSSRLEAVRVFNLIDRGIYPYRAVVLLEPSQTEPLRHSRHHWIHFEVDNLRILWSHNWRDVVHRICWGVPIIVLDTRIPSAAVVEETGLILDEPFLRHKTLFVILDDGGAPSVDTARPGTDLTELHTTRRDDVVTSLKEFGLIQTTSPDDNPALDKLSFAWNSKKLEEAMRAVSCAGLPYTTSLHTAERAHGCTAFVKAARNLQARLQGNPGDGALEVFAQLNADISATEAFISEWRDTPVYEYQCVIGQVVDIHQALCNLQQVIDYAPPHFLKINEEILQTRRLN